MMDFIEALKPVFIQGAIAIISALIVSAKLGIAKWIKEKTKNEVTQKTLTLINDVVFTLVNEAEQTVVKKIREDYLSKPKDGKYWHDMKRAKEAVMNNSMRIIGSQLGLANEDEKLALHELVNRKIEAAIPQAKKLTLENDTLKKRQLGIKGVGELLKSKQEEAVAQI